VLCASGRVDMVALHRSTNPSGVVGRQSIELLNARKAFETLDSASESSDMCRGSGSGSANAEPHLRRGLMCPHRFAEVFSNVLAASLAFARLGGVLQSRHQEGTFESVRPHRPTMGPLIELIL
jgi:hypothetical protein